MHDIKSFGLLVMHVHMGVHKRAHHMWCVCVCMLHSCAFERMNFYNDVASSSPPQIASNLF